MRFRLQRDGQLFLLAPTQHGAALDFFQAIRSGYSNFFNFSGRARRAEYWYFTLFSFGLSALLQLTPNGKPLDSPVGIAFWLIALSALVPNISVTARRLHDVGKSAWWMIISGIPIIGGLILLGWLIARGADGPNEYGRDPKQE